MNAFAVAATLIFLAAPAISQDQKSELWVNGTATVIDGDSIEIDGQEIRLFGIDAPEPDQVCFANTLVHSCGDTATRYLSDMIYGKTVKCRVESEDTYGRFLANCLWGKRNINEIMVLTGNAVAWRRHTDFYLDTERKAKDSKSGIWSTDFIKPEEWRAAKERQRVKSELKQSLQD